MRARERQTETEIQGETETERDQNTDMSFKFSVIVQVELRPNLCCLPFEQLKQKRFIRQQRQTDRRTDNR